ncbi:MAG: class I SAM-dependent methyltransferase [Verrucomicrobia bacterium]|nr:class I SAM-dependent methyltransferase [Verrucomicrobiota bacterium]
MITRLKSQYYERKFSKLPIEIRNYELIEGFLQPEEAAALYYFSKKVKNGVIVEIGSWKGKSTFCLARGLKNGKVFAIDPFNAAGETESAEKYEKEKGEKELILQFKEGMANLGVIDKIEILHGYSKDFVNNFKKINLLFIDGDHSIEGCRLDFEYFDKFIVKGGYILFHDYYANRVELGPTWVIKNIINKKKEYKFLHLSKSLWIGIKV